MFEQGGLEGAFAAGLAGIDDFQRPQRAVAGGQLEILVAFAVERGDAAGYAEMPVGEMGGLRARELRGGVGNICHRRSGFSFRRSLAWPEKSGIRQNAGWADTMTAGPGTLTAKAFAARWTCPASVKSG